VHGELDVTSPEDNVNPNGMRSTIASTIRGVMTKKVGAVTGDLEVATRPERGRRGQGSTPAACCVCSNPSEYPEILGKQLRRTYLNLQGFCKL
jgi:hypothetical protein